MNRCFVVFVMMISLWGCQKEPASEKAVKEAVAVASTVASQSQGSTDDTRVAKIVFIGQKEACECTRKRIAKTDAALQEALTQHRDLVVEHLLLDQDAARVAPYQQLKPIMVAPAIYLLGENNQLIEMLQGDVSTDQILIALGG